jgi:hypothetical protein|tara:strand:- start:1076 stop:1276 length:201 start_codon:yes stop_codon:yes gene_type:complete
MEAILNKDDYREFTQRVDIAVSKGQEVPHIVEMISGNQFRVTLLAKVDLELLDNITKDVKPQRIFP